VVKDNIGIKDQPLSLGIQPPLFERVEKSAWIVEVLEQAGATCIASTNLDELCANYRGQNRYFGSMFHPFDTELSPLGSSTGSAIAVALDEAEFGLGTDFGGSIRGPAATLGIFGFKLSAEWAPCRGAFTYGKLDSLGVFAKSFDILSRVVLQLGKSRIKTAESAQIKLWVPHSSELGKMPEKARVHFESLCTKLQKKFELKELEPIFGRALELRKPLAVTAMAEALAPFLNRAADFPAAAKAVLVRAEKMSAEKNREAEQEVTDLKNKLCSTLSGSDFFITPTLPGGVPTQKSLDERELVPSNIFLALANILELPALAFPTQACAPTAENCFSAQLLGSPGQESQMLVVADNCSKLLNCFAL
jgi:Asp-tRNA(Asn)/Glu-tRNA(Gln) amidotransferase A subunit family amidase